MARVTIATALASSVLVMIAAPAAHAIAVPVPADPPADATAKVTQYPPLTNGGIPFDVAVDGAGNVWFTDLYDNQVDRVTPAGAVTAFNTTGSPDCITRGPDGNVWFTEQFGPIGRMTPSGTLTEFPRSSGFINQTWGCIVAGPDGNLWYTDDGSSHLAKMSPTGTVTVLPVALPPQNGGAITAGPDGRIWFVQINPSQGEQVVPASIDRVNTDGTGLASFRLPPTGTFFQSAQALGLTAGPDGKIWFTTNADLVGNITTDGITINQYPTPYSGSEPGAITAGPDGNLWFTEINGDRVARVTPAGQIFEVLLPYQQYPTAIAAGDGQVWFAEPAQIASLDPATLVPPPTTPCLTVTASVVLHNDVGPCSADGIVVTGSNLTVNLAGHKVFAAPGARVGDFAGIHLKNATGVTVENGAVSGFDAGVWVESGSGNTLTHLDVHDNLGPANNAANMGDGIVLYHSRGNHITVNHVVHNGVFDGIAILGVGSDNNLIADNRVSDTTDEQIHDMGGSGSGIILDAFLESESLTRRQSLAHNDILNNTVTNSVSSGISSVSNLNARIEGNHVDGTGPNSPGTGIGVSANTAAIIRETGDVVSGNVVTNIRLNTGFNAQLNAAIHIRSAGNLVTNNHVSGPTPYGIVGDIILHTNTPVVGNTFTNNYAVGATFFDLEDFASDATGKRNCFQIGFGGVLLYTDTWSGNTYGTADEPCTTVGGHHVAAPPHPVSVAPASAASASMASIAAPTGSATADQSRHGRVSQRQNLRQPSSAAGP